MEIDEHGGVAGTGVQEVRADARVRANALSHVFNVSAQFLGQSQRIFNPVFFLIGFCYK